MKYYLVTVICKLTHDVQIWSVLAYTRDEAGSAVMREVNRGNQRGMWNVGIDEKGKEEIVEITDDTMMVASYDY